MYDNYKFILSDESGVYQIYNNISQSKQKSCDSCKEKLHTLCFRIYNRKENKNIWICEECLKKNKIIVYHNGEDLDLTKVSPIVDSLLNINKEFMKVKDSLFKKYFMCHQNNIKILKSLDNYMLPKNEFGRNCSYIELAYNYLNCIFTICYNSKLYEKENELNKEVENQAYLYYKLLNDWFNKFNYKYKKSLFIPDLTLLDENKLKYEDLFNMIRNCFKFSEINDLYNKVKKIFGCNEYTIKNVFDYYKNNLNDDTSLEILCMLPNNEYAINLCVGYLFNRRTKKTEEMEYLINYANNLLETISEGDFKDHLNIIIPYLNEALEDRQNEINEKNKRSEYIKALKEKSREVKTRKRKVKYE